MAGDRHHDSPQLKNAFTIILFGAIDAVVRLSCSVGDFRGRLDMPCKDTALGVMENFVKVYNRTIGQIPGVAKIDMATGSGCDCHWSTREAKETADVFEDEAVPATENLTRRHE